MADILIHMEMPEYCYECPCHNGESGYCQAYKSGYLGSIERPAKCPLVPLPEGHGRIVDASEILEKANNSPWFDGDVAELGLLLGSEVTTIVPAEGGGEDGN